MMHLLISILGVLLTIFFVIGTHESAHFLAARLLGVKVLRYSIGFGKALYRWHDKSGTEYILALIPLGGYVQMLDENEGTVAPQDLPRAFNRQPFYKKFLIVLAGPASNLLCAFALYWLIFVIGFITIKPVIGTVDPHSIAAKAGLRPKQEIISIDNKTTATWPGIIFRLLSHFGNHDELKMQTSDLISQKVQVYRLDLTTWHMDELNPDPLSSIGIKPFEPEIPLVIGYIGENTPAATSPLHLGDKIIALDQKPLQDWEALVTYVYQHPNTTINLSVMRAGKLLTLPITIGSQHDLLFQKYGWLGIGPKFEWPKELLHKVQFTPLMAVPHAWQEIEDFSYFNLVLFAKLFTGKLSVQSLGGPITIFESAGNALNSGYLAFLGFLAFLSISIGIINLLPIPGLDGGHLFLQIIELIIRRPLPEKYLNILFRVGYLFILFVLIQALANDILRLY